MRQTGFVQKIRIQASAFLDFDNKVTGAVVVDNAEWTNNMTVIDFLRDVGKHFSVNAMIQKESVRRRIEDDSSGISYTEFSYMVLQAYDYVVLNKRFDCSLQIGGSDQWGNITAGMDLIRRMEGKQAYAMTFPLITKADGTKFGKSESGTIWLDSSKTSTYSFYQFWFNCADEDVMSYINTFTFFTPEQIKELAQAHVTDPGQRTAQRALAASVTELVHGQDGLATAERISAAVFSNSVSTLSEQDLGQLALDGLPCTRVTGSGGSLVELLVETGLAVTPRGEITLGQARKFIQGNAVSVNGEKVTDLDYHLDSNSAMFGKYHLLQRGKKNHVLVEWSLDD
jgi:tyrosyl-tRNA synthetase